MLRRIKDSFTCEEKGARKDDELDRRATKNLSLSLKGLVYLVLNAELTERESRTIVDSAHACSEIGLKWFLFAFMT
jgi:hypothetical protein